MSKAKPPAGQRDYAVLADNAPLILLCIAAFLAPLIGGAVSTEAIPVEPGYSPLMRTIFGGTDLPTLSHFVLSLFVCAAAVWVLASKRIVQVPMVLFGVPALAFFSLIAATSVFSAFVFVTAPAVFEWVVYAVAAFGAVAIIGRRIGPIAVLSALFAGCSLLALLGIWEYLALSNDPSWRIFGTWQNPNALAGMLLLGFFTGIGLLMASAKPGPMAAFAAGTTAIALAIALTQSKGAYLASVIGLAVVFVLVLVWLLGKRGVALPSLGKVALCLVVLIGLLAGLRMRSHGDAAGAGPLGRVAQAESTQEQSAGFRKLLWQSAIQLARQKPLGWGIGTYRYESARPGLTTQTHFAHNSYLQLGAEAGIFSPLLFLGLGVIWLRYAFKGARTQNPEILSLKIGVVAAIVAAAVHNAVDSDLYFFGSGLGFFILLGVGLQLNVDGVTPESVQKGPRRTALVVAALLPFALLYFGAIEATKAHMKWHMAKGELEPASEGAKALASIAGNDGDSVYQQALIEPNPSVRLNLLRRAGELAPSTRNLRALARDQVESGNPVSAAASLRTGLERDPNNLPTLKLLFDVYRKADNEIGAMDTAKRLVAVEESSAFRIRALPELIPTETYFARKVLADAETDPAAKILLLRPAFLGLAQYAKNTVPNIATAVQAGMPQGYAGETTQDGLEKMKLAAEVTKELAAALRATGADEEATRVESDGAVFTEAIAKLGAAPPAP